MNDIVAHVVHGGKTEALWREVQKWGKAMRTIESEANSNILSLGGI